MPRDIIERQTRSGVDIGQVINPKFTSTRDINFPFPSEVVPMSITARDRAQDIRTAVPTNPAGSPSGVQQVQSSIANIINTGSKQPNQATLINPQTGDRQAVATGSAQAQELFGAGYVLEQTPGTPAAGAVSATTGKEFAGTEQVAPEGGLINNPHVPGSKTTQERLDFLREQASRVRAEAFDAVYGYTPDEWQNLDPASQRQLRNQRVQALATEYGNYNDAITQMKEETETARENAMTALATYSELGILQNLSDKELEGIARDAGLSAEALKTIPEEGWELKQLGADLVSIRHNPETGEIEIGSTYSTAGTGTGAEAAAVDEFGLIEFEGGSYPEDFVNWFNAYVRPSVQLPMDIPGTPDPITPGFVKSQFDAWNATQVGAKATRDVIADLQEDIEAGHSLSAIIRAYPEVSSEKVTKMYNDFYK